MISLAQATLRRSARTLLEKVTFTIFAGQHVGIVGKNGTGKSSLFQLLLGGLHTDAGEASMTRNLAIAESRTKPPRCQRPRSNMRWMATPSCVSLSANWRWPKTPTTPARLHIFTNG